MKKLILKLIDYCVLLAITLMLANVLVFSIKHITIIKNLPVQMDPVDKEEIYQSLINV